MQSFATTQTGPNTVQEPVSISPKILMPVYVPIWFSLSQKCVTVMLDGHFAHMNGTIKTPIGQKVIIIQF